MLDVDRLPDWRNFHDNMTLVIVSAAWERTQIFQLSFVHRQNDGSGNWIILERFIFLRRTLRVHERWS